MKSIMFITRSGDSLINFRGALIKDLSELGYEISAFVTEPPSKENLELLSRLNIKLAKSELNKNSTSIIKFSLLLKNLISFISQINPNSIFAYTVFGTLLASITKIKFKDKKYISLITGRGILFEDRSFSVILKRFLILPIYGFFLKRCDFVLFQNVDDKNLFLRKRLINDGLVINGGSGVDTSYFRPVPLAKKPVFLCIARLLKHKGIYEYAKAAGIVKKRYPEASFLLAGGEDFGADSIKTSSIKTWEAEFGIKYLGHINDVRSVISKSSIFVLLSYHEGIPRSTIEAMSMGRPIITTDAPGCKETVKNGQNGFLVEKMNYISTAEKMIDLIKDPVKIKVFGDESRKIALEEFDVKIVNKNIIKNCNL